jgi:predicted membrane protein
MSKDKAILGFVLVIVGIALLFHQLNFIPFFVPHFLFRWPMMLIIFGAFLFLTKPNKMPGVSIMVVGFLFLLGEINPGFNPGSWWPVFLILAGLGILFRKKKGGSEAEFFQHTTTSSNKMLDENAIFSGGERIIRTTDFSGGRVNAIFGGLEINLLHATLAPGRNTIEVFAAFGGVTFYIPSDWNVRSEVTAIFGGFTEQRVLSPAGTNSDRELVIKGVVMFGGGEIKSI